MSFYQPTNITPSLLAGNAEGTVDATDPLIVTWQINGSSPMRRYSIAIREAEADELVYSQQFNCDPTYGRDNLGRIVPFSHTIQASDITNYSNGKQYRLLLTLYPTTGGGVGPNTVAFQTAAKPAFTAASHSQYITTREHTFDFLTFSDTSLQWFRWVLYLNDGTVEEPEAGEVIYDTGNIFGSGDMTLTYSGFVNGISYAVRCTACDGYGREVTSDLYGFEVRYEETVMEFPIKVSAATTRSAVKVEWGGAFSIPGIPYGEYTINNEVLQLETSDDYVVWDAVNELPMSFARPWTAIYQGKLRRADAVLWKLGAADSSKALEMSFDFNSRTLQLKQGSSVLWSQTPIWWESTISTIVVADESGNFTAYIRIDYMTGGLYPANSLYPATTLFPQDEVRKATDKYTYDSSSASAQPITSITVYGKQYCYFTEVISPAGDVNEQLIEFMYTNLATEAPQIGNREFYATFEADLQAGSLYFLDREIAGWAIYRQETSATIARQIALLPMSVTGFYDYSARTDGTEYTYEIAPIFVEGDSYNDGSAIRSDEPFGIRNANYSILECEYSEANECYIAIAEYDFGKNLKTNSVSNNNSPSVLQNFTQYPTVQLAPQNYKSGSLTSLIGVLQISEDSQVVYSDTRQMRDKIYALSTTTNPLFLKTRKGDLFRIQISNAIDMSTWDGTMSQAQEATIPWVEVADADGMYILSYADLKHDNGDYAKPSESPIVPSGAITITTNGTYQVKQFAEAQVIVPNTYTSSDQGKVVDGVGLVAQSSRTITENGQYDTTFNNDLNINVPNTYTTEDQNKVVQGDELVEQTTTNIAANGTYNTTLNNSAIVNVPNTYTAADEGKVVNGGQLAAQTTTNITANGTYNTTQNNSAVVNVPNSYTSTDEGKVVVNGSLVTQTSMTVTENGTIDTTTVSQVTVALPSAVGVEF